MKYELCLFDLDGTLTDPKEGITKSVRYALNAFGIDAPDLDALTDFIGPPLRDSFREYYKMDADGAEAAVAKYREYYAVTGMYENALYDGVLDLLSALKSRGATLALATSKAAVYAERIAEHFCFAEYMTLVSGSGLDGSRGAKAEQIEYALDCLDPNRKKATVMIGDRKYDIAGAHENGIDSIGVTWGYGSRAELAEAGATYLADSPAALGKIL